MVLHYLLDGTMRFGALQRALRGISARTLTKQLRELESHGIIHREVHQQIPPKVEYSLTASHVFDHQRVLALRDCPYCSDELQ